MAKILVAAVAIAIGFCICCSAALADVVADWSGYVEENFDTTSDGGALYTVGQGADLSVDSPVGAVPSFSTLDISIPAVDTVSFSLVSGTDHGSADAAIGASIAATFKPVSSTLKKGTPVAVLISLSLTGSLDASAGNASAESSVSLTSSLGPPFDQSVAASDFESKVQPLSLTQSEVITAFVGQDFAFDPTIDVAPIALGGGIDGTADADAFGTLSFSAESLDSDAQVVDSSCSKTYSGTVSGNIRVSSGETCITGTVTGNVRQTGGILIATGATIEGDLQIRGGTFLIGGGTTIGGDLQIKNVSATPAPSRVCGTSVIGNLQVFNNAEPIEIGTALLSCRGNSVGGSLQCRKNSSITGSGNTAGSKQGECAGF